MAEEIGLAVGTENYWLTKMDIKIARLVFGLEGECQGTSLCQECRVVLASGNSGFYPHPFVSVRFSDNGEDALMALKELQRRFRVEIYSEQGDWACDLRPLGRATPAAQNGQARHRCFAMAICLAICDALEGERG